MLIIWFIVDYQGYCEGFDGLWWGVELICIQLIELGVLIVLLIYYDYINWEFSCCELCDGEFKEYISCVYVVNYGVYGVCKVWLILNCEGIEVVRCIVEWLMIKFGLFGIICGKVCRIMIVDLVIVCFVDFVQCCFGLLVFNWLWVVDFIYVLIWVGFVYVVFVIDVYVCRILGWWVVFMMVIFMVFDVIE